MKSFFTALIGFSAAAVAVPMHMHKRDPFVVTVYDAVQVTQIVTVTSTIVVYPTGDSSPAEYVAPTTSSYEYVAPTSSSYEYVAPTSSSEEYVAPTTSSYEYVAPTTSSYEYVAPTTSSSEYVAPTTSSSSEYVAPTTSSSSEYVAPTTSTYVSPSTTSSSATPSSTSGSGTGEYSGDGTFYDVGLGSCGNTNTDDELVVAVSNDLMSASDNGNSNNNPLCGKTITAYRGDKSVTVTVVDTCMGCAEYDLDFSPTAFDYLGEASEGRIPITWSWDN
ncbi:RlpA-like double-psi beta-barrel-protein domain-containing protein-containing protein [Dipodascopsis uninucleata]